MTRPPIGISTSRLGRQRRLVADVVALARRVPVFPVERVMDLSSLDRARSATTPRIGWTAIFTKAYAIVARDEPSLRSWRLAGWPPRLATSSISVATVSVNRRVGDEDVLYWARLAAPDGWPLEELHAEIRRHATDPIEQLYRRQSQLASLPDWLRRTVLWWNLHSASPKRPLRMGTFSISSLAGQGAFNRLHPSPLTTSLAYGPLDSAGHCLVTLLADHRLLDGVPAARVAHRLEEVLRGEILNELETRRPRWRTLLWSAKVA